MRQNRVHLMPPMSNFYARICVKATPSSNTTEEMNGATEEPNHGAKIMDASAKRLDQKTENLDFDG